MLNTWIMQKNKNVQYVNLPPLHYNSQLGQKKNEASLNHQRIQNNDYNININVNNDTIIYDKKNVSIYYWLLFSFLFIVGIGSLIPGLILKNLVLLIIGSLLTFTGFIFFLYVGVCEVYCCLTFDVTEIWNTCSDCSE